MNAQPGSAFASSWLSYRVADALDVVFWLYNRTGDAFLLTLADTMHCQQRELAEQPADAAQRQPGAGIPRTGACTRSAPASRRMTQDAYQNYASIMGTYGQFPGGGFAGDENDRLGYRDPRQGFETCGIVELMASHELLSRLTGDPVWADRCEQLAFNMLPAALDPQGKGTHYVTSANSVDLSNTPKSHGQFSNTFAMQAYMPGVDQYRCCPHNYGQGWPYFTEELWAATPDNGLCAVMYAPCSVTANVSGGTSVTITETHRVSVHRHDHADADDVRTGNVPAVPPGPRLVLGAVDRGQRPGRERAGRPGVHLDLAHVAQRRHGDDPRCRPLPSSRSWSSQGGALSVSNGALDYSLQIGENYVQFAGSSEFPEYEVHATTPWNYGLALPSSNPAGALTFHAASGSVPSNPFTQASVPVSITAPAAADQAWTADDQNVVDRAEPGAVRRVAAPPTSR